MDDNHYMSMALSLAAKGFGYTSPNPVVGAVVVRDNQVLGKGWHKAYGKAHAEVNALDEAGKNAQGATIYVTLEPCNHTGKTPPCTDKILKAGISKVVIAMPDPNPVAAGGIEYLRSRGVTIVQGVMEKEAALQNEIFLKNIRTGKPFVALKCASTLDGRIATRTGDSKWITGERARRHVHELRHRYDGILVGIGTVMADNPSLTARLDGQVAKDPVRIVMDTGFNISPDAKLFDADSSAGVIIATGPDISQSKKKELEKKGAEILSLPLSCGYVDPCILMEKLAERKIMSVLVEGGGIIAGSFLGQGRKGCCLDKVYMFYGSKLLGGSDGTPVISGVGPEKIRDCVNLSGITIRQFDDDILVEGYVGK